MKPNGAERSGRIADQQSGTLLDRLQHRQDELTSSERDLARHLVDTYPQGALETASALARTTGVSAATVVRLFAKLGYENANELQREARLEVSRRLLSPGERARLQSEDTPLSEFVAQSHEQDIANLRRTLSTIEPELLEAVVARLAASDGTLFVMGEKNSYPIAYHAATHLNICRPRVILLETGQARLADRLLWVEPGDALLCVSVRRYSPNTTKAAKHFHSRGMDVIALTDSPLSPLSPFTTHMMVVQTGSPSIFDSFTAAMALVTGIAGAVAAHNAEQIHDILTRGEGLWAEFGTFQTGQNLADRGANPPRFLKGR